MDHTYRHILCHLASCLSAIWIGLPTAFAQTAEGSLHGQATAGVTVRVLSLDTGMVIQRSAGAAGVFSFPRLPPGRYRVSAGDISQEVTVSIGVGTDVQLLEVARVEVRVSGTRSTLDMSSFESGSTFSQEDIRALPIARNFNAVTLLAPGAVRGSIGGGQASFGGASVAENGYYINGFDVTNLRDLMSYAELPFDAMAQQQIKTGGFGAEFGRALGGVQSVVTQRGGNIWRTGISVEWDPSRVQAPRPNVLDRDPTRPGAFTLFQSADHSDPLKLVLHAGGPIVPNRLFVFGLLEAHHDESHSFAQNLSTINRDTSPRALLKLDWTPIDNHSLEFTGIWNKVRTTQQDFTSAVNYSTAHDGQGRTGQTESGGDVAIAKYTGYLTDRLTVSALLGQLHHLRQKVSGARTSGSACPTVLDVALNPLGCWTPPFPGAATLDLAAPDDHDVRTGGRIDAEYQLGGHTVRAGWDSQNFKSFAAGNSAFSGGIYYRYFDTADGSINGVANAAPVGSRYVRSRISQTTSGAYRVHNGAMYLEDAWQATPQLLLHGGVRLESFNNLTGDDQSFARANKLLAPRTGLVWNVLPDQSLKIFGSAGRYFIPVAANTNIRFTRGDILETRFYRFTGVDPKTGAPLGLSAEIGDPQVLKNGGLPTPGTLADTRLQPMNQDEFILGFERAASKHWTFGAKAVYRRVNDGMDDYCGHQPITQWVQSQGYTSFDPASLAPCVLLNPGRDVHLNMDLRNDGVLRPMVIPAAVLDLPAYLRSYKALELTVAHPFDGRWGMSASYVWSRSEGTSEGYVQSDLGQDDAGITQDFDFASFTKGARGLLPNDRRHTFKLYGSVALTAEWRVSANALVQSGRPTSCLGFVPPGVPDYQESSQYPSASSYYCLQSTSQGAVITQRGTAGALPWTRQLDLGLRHTPSWAAGRLTLQVDVANVFNRQSATAWNQQQDYSRDTSKAAPYRLNFNYQAPTSTAAPRSVHLTARWVH